MPVKRAIEVWDALISAPDTCPADRTVSDICRCGLCRSASSLGPHNLNIHILLQSSGGMSPK